MPNRGARKGYSFGTFDRLGERIDCLFGNQKPGNAVDHCLQRPAGTVGNHRTATSIHLERGHAKVFELGKQQGAGAAHEHDQFLVADMPAILYGAIVFLNSIAGRAHDNHAPPDLRCGRDCEIDAFVGDRTRRYQVVIAITRPRRKSLHIDWRMQEFTSTTIVFLDPMLRGLAVGQKEIDSGNGDLVPDPKIAKKHGRRRSQDSRKCFQFFMRSLPQCAHRGVAITDVGLLRGPQEALCGGVV